MKVIFLALCYGLLFSFAIFVGTFIFTEPGYVLVSYGKEYFEMTLITLLLLLFGSWLVLRVIIFTWQKVMGISSATSFYFFSKSERKAREALHQGLTAFLLKDWSRAEKLLSASGDRSGLLESKHMFAAVAADAAGDDDKVLVHLNALDDDEVDTALLKADLWLRRGEYEEASEILSPLFAKKPKDDAVLILYVRLLGEMQDWQALLVLLPQIEKQAIYDEKQLNTFAYKVVDQALTQTVLTQSVEAAEQQWKQLSGKMKKQSYAISAYVGVLAANGHSEQAGSLLLKTLKRSSLQDYLPVFRQVTFSQPLALNKYLQGELKNDEDNPQLLCALGHLAAASGDHTLATKALAKAVQRAPVAEDLRVLANTYSDLGENGKAVAIYQKLNG
jgi:HemY protein